MKNGVKNGENTQFNSNNQPSGEAKSEGWKRKKSAQAFMDKVMEYQELSLEEFERIEKEAEKSKAKYTIRDVMAIKYVSKGLKSDKFLLDWVDRHVSKAQFNKEDENQKEPISKYIIEIVEPKYSQEEFRALSENKV
ncbi:hypothetical protein DOJK_01098 [Patescibacteria group bacterium]|nr:hypothetical protein DOJK_01098 [Patescibacteria group bacterium]